MIDMNSPTLLLDKQKCIRNIDAIVAKAKRSGIRLRPHFKTHQSHEIGHWFRERGVQYITVSSLEMAEYFAADDWKDITVAFPLNFLEVDRINTLASKIKLNLLVSVPGVLHELLKKLTHKVGIFLEIDTGYHRTGIDPDDDATLQQVLTEIELSSLLKLEGLLSHAGHTYKCKSKKEVQAIHQKEILLMNGLRDKLKSKFSDLVLSIGDTPSASMMDDFSGVDELRAGNLVFYDLVQTKIGACTLDQIAIALVCPVVAVYPQRNEIIIYGGGVHFSKDFLVDENGKTSFGSVVMLNDKGWELPATEMFMKALSQEHGIVHAPDVMMDKIKPGTLLGILPVHACLMADANRGYVTTDGTRIEKFN